LPDSPEPSRHILHNMARYSTKAQSPVPVPGFQVAGVHCDVRGRQNGRLDLALFLSELPCTLAGAFTRNRMAAAPVKLCREVLAKGQPVKALLVNSGNANACTGSAGLRDAKSLQSAVAAKVKCPPEAVLICSTGRIGEPLPIERLFKGIDDAAESLSVELPDWEKAGDAILTSDTHRKLVSRKMELASGTVTVSGMAKGAGMIEPNMATMLAFLFADAELPASLLQELLMEAVEGSFNAITVDGDESTNDTVLAFANGKSGVRLEKGSPDWALFAEAVVEICTELAGMIVGDGEKITRVVEVCIENAATDGDARKAARAIGNSLLVKSSWFGGDPNWGRLMDAIGYSGADVTEESVDLWYCPCGGERVPVFTKGQAAIEHKARWAEIVRSDRFQIHISLGRGNSSYRLLSTDLTEGYVNFNKSE